MLSICKVLKWNANIISDAKRINEYWCLPHKQGVLFRKIYVVNKHLNPLIILSVLQRTYPIQALSLRANNARLNDNIYDIIYGLAVIGFSVQILTRRLKCFSSAGESYSTKVVLGRRKILLPVKVRTPHGIPCSWQILLRDHLPVFQTVFCNGMLVASSSGYCRLGQECDMHITDSHSEDCSFSVVPGLKIYSLIQSSVASLSFQQPVAFSNSLLSLLYGS